MDRNGGRHVEMLENTCHQEIVSDHQSTTHEKRDCALNLVRPRVDAVGRTEPADCGECGDRGGLRSAAARRLAPDRHDPSLTHTASASPGRVDAIAVAGCEHNPPPSIGWWTFASCCPHERRRARVDTAADGPRGLSSREKRASTRRLMYVRQLAAGNRLARRTQSVRLLSHEHHRDDRLRHRAVRPRRRTPGHPCPGAGHPSPPTRSRRSSADGPHAASRYRSNCSAASISSPSKRCP